ncbi:menaquinol-cytochrome c reductase iron-sulfur subunit [soil metagenome]
MTSLTPAPEQPPVAGASRRSFLGVLLGLASAMIAALLGIPVVRYLLYPLTAESKASGWSAAGPLSEATTASDPLIRTLDVKREDGWRKTESSPKVYLVKTGTTVQALSAICPHLGCTLPWDASRKEFVCPCHGGVFGPDGAYRSGPPRRGMDTLETRVTGGTVLVKYQTFRPDVPNKQVTS